MQFDFVSMKVNFISSKHVVAFWKKNSKREHVQQL